MANQLGKFGHSCPPMVAKSPEETRAARGALLALRELLLLPWRETTRRSARRAAAEGGIRLWKERAILPAAMIDAVMCWWTVVVADAPRRRLRPPLLFPGAATWADSLSWPSLAVLLT